MTDIVASMYGCDTTVPSTDIAIPSGVHGAMMRSAETNWLDTLPCTLTRPPPTGPRTESGGVPPADSHAAPIDSSASTRCMTGLLQRLASPVSLVTSGESAATAAAMRNVVPEFSAFIDAACGCGRPTMQTSRVPSPSTVAPNAAHARAVARVSSESSAPRTALEPSASEATKSALCV